jgi:hypothetical protein
MVAAVVAIARIDSDWADLVAIALLVAVLGLLMRGLRRRLDEEEPLPPDTSERDR